MRPTRRPILPIALGIAALLIPAAAAPVRADRPPEAKADADVSGLAGSWTWTWKDPAGEEHKHVLDVEGVDTKLAARERRDDLAPVRVIGLKLEKKKVRFTVARGGHRADYVGVLADKDTINGTVTVTADGQSEEHVWKATRRPAPKDEEKPKPE